MLKVDLLCESNYNSNTYIVGDEVECIVIDPSNDVRNIKKLIGQRKLMGIFLTHGHFDHFRTIQQLLKEYQTIVYLHKNALTKLKDPNISCSNMFGYNLIINFNVDEYCLVNDGLKINIFDTIKVLYTPGHTNCSVCYIINGWLFSGDCLFQMGVGRYDLPTGSVIELNKSIKRLLNLKTNYVIYPGHGDTTTIIDEIKTNPFYQQIK